MTFNLSYLKQDIELIIRHPRARMKIYLNQKSKKFS